MPASPAELARWRLLEALAIAHDRDDPLPLSGLGQAAFPNNASSAQGAALAVSRLARTLLDEGLITAAGGKSRRYAITPAGLTALPALRQKIEAPSDAPATPRPPARPRLSP
jgi:hypothetical protein